MTNCRLKRNNFRDNEGNKMYGFILMRKGQKHEFYSYHQEEANAWILSLKSHAILLDFKDQISIGKILGKGTSAKVHECARRIDPSTFFAMKTVDKKFIKKNEQNLVSYPKLAH